MPTGELAEVLGLIKGQGLAGSGFGWVDAHLLASAMVGSSPIWTLDSPPAAWAARLGVLAD